MRALSGKSIKLSIKSGENGKLFGAVSGKDIADAVSKQLGIELDKKKIVLGEPIKTTGPPQRRGKAPRGRYREVYRNGRRVLETLFERQVVANGGCKEP